MNLRRAALAGLGLVAAACALAWWAMAMFLPAAQIDIEPAQLQQRLDARFPQRNCALMVACITISHPVLTLAEGSPRIGLAADLLVSLGRRELPGRVAFSGVLRYVRYQGDFFLDDLQVDDFALAGLAPEFAQVVRQRGPAALRRALDGHPVYTLRDDGPRAALARLAVRDVRVVGGRVRVTFMRFGR